MPKEPEFEIRHGSVKNSGNRDSSASSRHRRAVRARFWMLLLIPLAGALAVGIFYFRSEPDSRSDAGATEPRIVRMERESQVVEDLMDFERVCLYQFSGMLLEVWLEATVEVPEEGAQFIKGLPLATPHYRWIDHDKPTADNAIGHFAIWGGKSSTARQRLNLSLRLGAASENHVDTEAVSAILDAKKINSRTSAPNLVVPWPDGLPKSLGSGHSRSSIQSLVPEPLPPVGEAFPVFQYVMSDQYKDFRDEQLSYTEPPDLRVTVQLMARRLPFESPQPHEDEIKAVAALRDRGFLVCQEGTESREHEGNDGGRAVRIHGGLSRVAASSKPSDDDMRQIGSLLQAKELYLWRANLTDPGLEHLADLKQLTTLEIRFGDESAVTAEGLRSIGRLQALERLCLEGIPVTDEAVPGLQQLTNLKELYIHRGCELSDEAIKQLEMALPRAKITCR